MLGQELLAYQEGVTAEGRADEFASMRGTNGLEVIAKASDLQDETAA